MKVNVHVWQQQQQQQQQFNLALLSTLITCMYVRKYCLAQNEFRWQRFGRPGPTLWSATIGWLSKWQNWHIKKQNLVYPDWPIVGFRMTHFIQWLPTSNQLRAVSHSDGGLFIVLCIASNCLPSSKAVYSFRLELSFFFSTRLNFLPAF